MHPVGMQPAQVEIKFQTHYLSATCACLSTFHLHNLVLCLLQAWVLVESSLYAVPLKVPRAFYVNSTLPPDDSTAAALGPRVSRTLPYGAEAHNIYQARAFVAGCRLCAEQIRHA